MQTKMTVDDVLEQQKRTALIATIEAIGDERGTVKVTPFNPGGGGFDELALRVPRESINSLLPTGERKLCCGKLLRVFEIEFNEKASMPIVEAFQRLQARPQLAAADGLAHRACVTSYVAHTIMVNGVQQTYYTPVTKCTGPYVPG
jgi:hypothetical protein